MSGEPGKNYEVGRGKPPVATRFKKGTSGNPLGRRRIKPPPNDPGSILQAIDNEEIEVRENGKRKRMKLVELEFRQMFNKAIKGDSASASLILGLAKEHLSPEATSGRRLEFIGVTEATRQFGSNYLQRIQELNRSGWYN